MLALKLNWLFFKKVLILNKGHICHCKLVLRRHEFMEKCLELTASSPVSSLMTNQYFFEKEP
ncbi:hypothetical protein DMC01_09045 [Campylobacter troglodytis]|nr:hypothetical protein DMC01_09045 [Campylobacter troglodytis]